MDKPLTDLRKAPAQERAAATFDAILDATAHILRDGGVRALSTNKIAARAGVSIGSLYQYFPNKQSIARALIERHIARVERLRPAVLDDPGAPATAVMRAAVDWHFESHRMDAGLATALRELAAAVLPADERERLVTLRRQRVGRTVSRLVGDATPEKRDRSVFLVDVCLGFIAQQTMRHHPAWLNSTDFRDEVTALLVASCCDRPAAGRTGSMPCSASRSGSWPSTN